MWRHIEILIDIHIENLLKARMKFPKKWVRRGRLISSKNRKENQRAGEGVTQKFRWG